MSTNSVDFEVWVLKLKGMFNEWLLDGVPGKDRLDITDGDEEGMFESMENMELLFGSISSFMLTFSKSFSKRN